MQRVVEGEENVVQPVHWLLEVAAVLTRISPDSAEDDVLMLAAMELPIAVERRVPRRADVLTMPR